MRSPRPKALVINPGSTSTKMALYHGRKVIFETELKHSRRSLERFARVLDQVAFRKRAALRALAREGVALAEIDVFVGRGGLLRPVPGGTYEVNDVMLRDLRTGRFGEHASNLGGILAAELAAEHGKNAYVADPPVVDELSDVARVSGHPDLPRRSVFHALSQKAVARQAAARLGKPYEKCNLIIAHVGGGVSVGAHRRGRVVDVNNALEGEGPFTPERTGGLSLLAFYRYALGKGLSPEQAARLVTRDGGLGAHLGTNDCRRIEQRIAAGDEKCRLVFDAFVYQVGKEIGAMAAALAGKVDAIVLTGGVVRGSLFRRKLKRMVRFLAPVHVLIGPSEMAALGLAGMEAYTGLRKTRTYGNVDHDGEEV